MEKIPRSPGEFLLRNLCSKLAHGEGKSGAEYEAADIERHGI